MKISIVNSVLSIAIVSLFLFACVPARQLEEIKTKKQQCETENAQLKTTSQELTTKNTEMQASIEALTKRLTGLCMDTNILGTSQRILSLKNSQLNKLYEDLLRNYDKLNAGNATETQKIMKQLQVTQDSLLNKEDALKKLASELEAKRASIEKNSKDLQILKANLEQKELKLAELQSILNKKDSIVKALKSKVTDALVGYEGKGLTITQKNGKIYVSLDESLLFASGSFTVDPKGVEAIKKLSKVLENNSDINVLIEGHTDNVPYGGTGALKDNWDLSVMRATAIVKILVSNSTIDPKRLSAAGKSQFDPVDVNTTKEGRAKNRRTEIILTPKLDELFQIIESN